MEGSKEFDATLGGTEHLPYSANSLKFAASRSVEIAAMTESILRPSRTKLIFQTLPVHMRRRVMSHNSKRLPRKWREGHLEQLKKSGLPPKQKRPSRKYRRRPANLLKEYTRRQKINKWLETHIWHAKRFHMIEWWGYRLAYAPCDKAFRACYRATSAHCLIQDVSYHVPVLLQGTIDDMKTIFSKITSNRCGLSVTAKAFTNGNREGSIHIFEQNRYPFGYIGKVSFIWELNGNMNKLWLLVHPALAQKIEKILYDLIHPVSDVDATIEVPIKRLKLAENQSSNVQIKTMPGSLNRFRLTGPNSHAVVVNALKCVKHLEKSCKWAEEIKTEENLEVKEKYWQDLSSLNSPAQLPCRMIVGLVVKDPRLSRPSKRTKARINKYEDINSELLTKIPAGISSSPLWDTELHSIIKEEMLSNGQFIQHVTNNQLVPGEVYEDDPALQSVPVILVQRPGSQDPHFKKLGYGCGWDIILPPGYALPFWHTFIMFGARAGGLRETESLAFEMGESYLPIDSEAGRQEEDRTEREMRDKYFRRPASKRVNYVKFGVNSPFRCQWRVLLSEWSLSCVEELFVLRDRQLLDHLQDCIDKKQVIPEMDNAGSCLVAVHIELMKKGNLKRHALICAPAHIDIKSTNTLFEPPHEDKNEKVRKQTKSEHKRYMKKLKRKRMKMKKNGKLITTKKVKKIKNEPSEYVQKMRELWLPSRVETVRRHCSRELVGYVSQGAFSFSEAKSCGVGYIAYNALRQLLNKGIQQVLVRNTCSRTYRVAKVRIIKQ